MNKLIWPLWFARDNPLQDNVFQPSPLHSAMSLLLLTYNPHEFKSRLVTIRTLYILMSMRLEVKGILLYTYPSVHN